MTIKEEKLKIIESKNQLKLFGFTKYFNSFKILFERGKLPNTILLSGPKGSGKATFIYHFINFLLSYKEKNSYSLPDFTIHFDNMSYKSICSNTNPNFSLLDSNINDENIKIEKIRNLINFLSKSTYSSNIKLILIDNAEFLNLNSSNALLKVLEESNRRTFFFIIHNSNEKILNTIKSRCIEFKISFSLEEKKEILGNIVKQYADNFDLNSVNEDLYLDSPGNILKYLLILQDNNIDFLHKKLESILILSDKYKKTNDSNLLNLIMMMIELHYRDLSIRDTNNITFYETKKIKILSDIKFVKKFNLDKKNFFTTLIGELEHESK